MLVAYLPTLGCEKEGRFPGLAKDPPSMPPPPYNPTPQINSINKGCESKITFN